MTGSNNAQADVALRGSWLARLAGFERRFFPVDGGAGAALLARLPMLVERLRCVPTPRHAELLVVCEPVSRKLAPSIVELYLAMPCPCRLVVIGEARPDQFPDADLVRMEDLFADVLRVSCDLGAIAIGQQLLNARLHSDDVRTPIRVDAATFATPSKHEREMATEPVVLSLGPVQPLAAGPLRVLLVGDGEQIVSASIEAGYATRRVAEAMRRATWAEAAQLASLIDPLAPVAGRIAYVLALERLRQSRPDEAVSAWRRVLLALERTQNHLVWLARFGEVLSDRRLIDAGRQIGLSVAQLSSAFQEAAPVEALAPHRPGLSVRPVQHSNSVRLVEAAAAALVGLRTRLDGDRALGLRTDNIGVLSADRLLAVGASGPVLRASQLGRGDVRSRLLARLDQAIADLHCVATAATALPATEPDAQADWSAPPGQTEVAVDGPRGQIGLVLTSDAERLERVQWRGPSAALLGLLPQVLAHQKLADAEVIVTSLDLAMAEADG